MEVFKSNTAIGNQVATGELPSWNRQRTREELIDFIARREAAISEYAEEL